MLFLSKKTNKSFRNSFFVITLFFVMFIFGANKAFAWDAIPAEIMHETWAEASEKVKSIAIAAAKQNGIKQFTQAISEQAKTHFVGGDYKDYLSGQVGTETVNYVGDYYKKMAENETGVNSGYVQRARKIAENAIMNDLSPDKKEANIEALFYEEVDARDNLFNQKVGGGVGLVPAMISNRNNLYGGFLADSTKINKTKEVIKESRKTEVTGHGYTGDGNTSGSTFAEIAKETQEGLVMQELIANANSPYEVAELVGSEYDPGDLMTDALKAGKEALRDQAKKAWRYTYQNIAQAAVGCVIGQIAVPIPGAGCAAGAVTSITAVHFVTD